MAEPDNPSPTRRLNLDLRELEDAIENASWELSYYLDLETGRVVMVTDEARRELNDLYQAAHDAGDEAPSLTDILQSGDLPDWRREALREADEVETGLGARYIAMPRAESHEAYRDMEAFIETVREQRLQERLWRAIGRRGAFRRFKDVLADHPRERERWFEFKDARVRRRVLDWLEVEGIEPIIQPPPALAPSPPQAPARSRLIAETLAFVRAARQLPGVTRIALIGSLTTGEPEPKDADLLVTVTAEADLAPLAALARRLQGHAQSFNRGADVFLADPQGNYLGRTCPWKRCGPGIRASCDALHCGRQPYLHNDLETIRLAPRVVAEPPVELWPEIRARIPLPDDLQEGLILPLQE